MAAGYPDTNLKDFGALVSSLDKSHNWSLIGFQAGSQLAFPLNYEIMVSMRSVVYVFVLFLLLWTGPQVIAGAEVPAKKATAKGQLSQRCTKKEMDLKSCHLKLHSYQVRFSKDKITIDDGTWKAVHELPLAEESVIWERVGLRQLGARWIVELEMWTSPVGDAGIQDLKWYLYELTGTKWDKKVEEVVQKRRRRLNEEAGSSKKNLFQVDRKEPYSLRLGKSGQLEWAAGRTKGSF